MNLFDKDKKDEKVEREAIAGLHELDATLEELSGKLGGTRAAAAVSHEDLVKLF